MLLDRCFFCSDSKTASNHEVSWARNLVLLHAKAAGLDAIDLVNTNFKDTSLLENESRQGFELGFTGKQIIHPNQIEVVQRTFAPDAKTLEWACKVMKEAEKQEGQLKQQQPISAIRVLDPMLIFQRFPCGACVCAV